MWDCGYCDCQSIAHDLGFCPQCFKEREVPKTTVNGGPSNVPEAEEPQEPVLLARDPEDDPKPVKPVVRPRAAKKAV